MIVAVLILLALEAIALVGFRWRVDGLRGRIEEHDKLIGATNRLVTEANKQASLRLLDERGRRIADIREVNERISAAHKAVSERVDATILDRVKLLETKVSNIEHGGSDQDRWRG